MIDYEQLTAAFSLLEGEPEPHLGLTDLRKIPYVEKSVFDDHISDVECWISVGVGMTSRRFVVCIRHLIYAWQSEESVEGVK